MPYSEIDEWTKMMMLALMLMEMEMLDYLFQCLIIMAHCSYCFLLCLICLHMGYQMGSLRMLVLLGLLVPAMAG